jgi:hypothetical protein
LLFDISTILPVENAFTISIGDVDGRWARAQASPPLLVGAATAAGRDRVRADDLQPPPVQHLLAKFAGKGECRRLRLVGRAPGVADRHRVAGAVADDGRQPAEASCAPRVGGCVAQEPEQATAAARATAS